MKTPYLLIRALGHKTQKLRPGETVRIGRHPKNDFVLADEDVSRFHATIAWDEGEDRPYVQDDASVNGIVLDDRPVNVRSHLTGNNNQLEVGKTLLVLTLQGTSRPTRALRKSEKSLETTKVKLFQGRYGEFVGRFSQHETLRDLFFRLEDEECTGTLVVNSNQATWAITFALGAIINVTSTQNVGKAALEDLRSQDAGDYKFEQEIEPTESALNLSPRDWLSTSEVSSD